MKDFLYGFFYPFKAVKFFFAHPKLISLSIIPMIINMIIYGSVFVFSYLRLVDVLQKLTGTYSNEAGIIAWILYITFLISGFILVLLLSYFLFVIFGGLVTAPFNENISQKVEEIVTGKKDENKLSFLQDAKISIIGELQKLAFYFPVIFILFLFNFVPGIGSIVSGVIGFIFSAYFNALDFLDYPMTRKMMKFKFKLRVVNKGRWLTYGFGSMAFLMMFLPVVNVFMKPILVAAGTSLYYEKSYDKY